MHLKHPTTSLTPELRHGKVQTEIAQPEFGQFLPSFNLCYIFNENKTMAQESRVLKSCDTFVVLNPFTENGSVIFGKNSDRPKEEVQDIVFYPAAEYPTGTLLQCTYIEIEQASSTNAVVLSKPNWMWGAEMGANEHGVCIGNEAVSTKLESDEDMKGKLLGMDLLRLGLERGNTAKEALIVITGLLEQYGQGGPCSNTVEKLTYHNSFIICDSQEAYVLETAKDLWAAEKVTEGYRNISNCLSVGTNIDMMSNGLKNKVQELGLWDGQGDFHFANIFSGLSENGCRRFENGSQLLNTLTGSGDKFNAQSMFRILRDEDSGICMRDGAFISTSSMVSVLNPSSSKRPNVHWLTGTPDPVLSVFKPFIFTANASVGNLLVSPDKANPHAIYALHQTALKSRPHVFPTLAEAEKKCYDDVNEFIGQIEQNQASIDEMDGLFHDCAEAELKFYNTPSKTSPSKKIRINVEKS